MPPRRGVLASRTDPVTGPELVLLDRTGAELATESLASPVDGVTRWGSLALASAGEDLIAVEWGIDDGTLPLAAPLGPLYVSGYARLAG